MGVGHAVFSAILQKIASPSYDVYSYVVLSAFMVNLLNLARVTRFKDVTKTDRLYPSYDVFHFVCKEQLCFCITFIVFSAVVYK